MKLIQKEAEEELYFEEDCPEHEYTENTYFSNAFLKHIVNEKETISGDLYGRIIHADLVRNALYEGMQADFFEELDEISQLCCNVAEHILSNPSNYLDVNTERILFLNRLSLSEGFNIRENEEEALNMLFNYADVIIYSFGSTELDDDFPETDEHYWIEYEQMLNDIGWEYDPVYGFYIKRKTRPKRTLLFEGPITRKRR